MADSILPWISDYLIGIGEECGANISNIPLFEKKKKVQLVEFLTFGSENGDCIWAKVSDKQHAIPIRLSEEAVAEYNRLNNKRVTQHKTAVISIKDFRPFFSRIPIGRGHIGMSPDACLAFECKSFTVIGSAGEAQWGNPKEIENNDDLRLWTEGLRQDGGGGNILKERKKERDQSNGGETGVTKPTRLPQRKIIESTPKKGAKKRPSSKDQVSTLKYPDGLVYGVPKIPKPDLLKDYERAWRPIQLDPWQYSRKSVPNVATVTSEDATNTSPSYTQAPPTLEPPLKRRRVGPIQHALDLSSQPEMKTPEQQTSDHNSPGSQPLTDWSLSPSVRGSPIRRGTSQPPPELDIKHPGESALPDTSYIPSQPLAPTPGQRPKPYAPTTSSLSPSTPAVPPPRVLSAGDYSPALSAPIHQRRSVTRKVPRPPDPLPPNRATGPARILVPNSDTSGIASQSLSQSQSQSQPHDASQPVILPRLPTLPVTQKHEHQSWGEDISAGPADHNSLFSSPGRSQPESYDDDRSSPARSAVKRIRSLPHKGPPSHDRDEVVANASTVALSGISRKPVDDSETKNESGDKDKGDDPHEVDDLQNDIDEEQVESRSVVQDRPEDKLDEDGAQTDEQLFGPRAHPRILTLVEDRTLFAPQSTPALANKLTTDILLHSSTSNDPIKQSYHGPSLLLSLQDHPHSLPTPEPPSSPRRASLGGTTKYMSRRSAIQLDVRAVEHDAEAWKAPSFLQNPDVDTPAMRPIEDLSVGGKRLMSMSHLSTQKKRLELSGGTETTFDERKSDPVNDGHISNRTSPDTLGRRYYRYPNGTRPLPALSVDRAPQAKCPAGNFSDGRYSEGSVQGKVLLPRMDGTLNPTERDRNLWGTDSLDSESQTTKRRKVRSSPPYIPNEERGQFRKDRKPSAAIKDEAFDVALEVPVKQKLAGFTVNLDNIPLSDSGMPWLSWGKLKEILLRTGRSQRN